MYILIKNISLDIDRTSANQVPETVFFFSIELIGLMGALSDASHLYYYMC